MTFVRECLDINEEGNPIKESRLTQHSGANPLSPEDLMKPKGWNRITDAGAQTGAPEPRAGRSRANDVAGPLPFPPPIPNFTRNAPNPVLK